MNYCRVPKALIASSLALAVVLAFTETALTQTMGRPEKFTANAMDMNKGRAGQLQISVTRWSTPSERAALVEIENFQMQPVMLTDVRAERKG